jgi:rhodanese-related sulfurtransferase
MEEQSIGMPEPRRLFAWDLGHKLRSGLARPLVVCADDVPQQGERMKIDGSISLKEFESRLDSIPTNREIVFYGSPLQDATAARRAAECQKKGFTRVEILAGGIDAWNAISSFL